MKYGENIYKTICNFAKWKGLTISGVEKELNKPKGFLWRFKSRENITLTEVFELRGYVGLEVPAEEFIGNVFFDDKILENKKAEIEKQIAVLRKELEKIDKSEVEG